MSDYRGLMERRIDIPSLQRQLSLLSSSDGFRRSMIEALDDRAALVKLQQTLRSAVEEGRGKLLSSVEAATAQKERTVAVLIRARMPEPTVAEFIGRLENGNPRLRIDEFSLVSRSPRAEDIADIELTATVRAQWSALERS